VPLAAELGATALRFVGGSSATRLLPREPQIRALTRWLARACEVAADHRIPLAMENHADLTAEEMVRLIDAVSSDYLRVNLDTGNALRVFDDPVEATRLLAPYSVATHLKDIEVDCGSPRDFAFWRSCPIGQGIIDIPAVVGELRAAGYAGSLTVEIDLVHPRWDHLPEETIVRESVAYLRQTLQDLDVARSASGQVAP
jgi:sugar phosphate isomerase/epimerase